MGLSGSDVAQGRIRGLHGVRPAQRHACASHVCAGTQQPRAQRHLAHWEPRFGRATSFALPAALLPACEKRLSRAKAQSSHIRQPTPLVNSSQRQGTQHVARSLSSNRNTLLSAGVGCTPSHSAGWGARTPAVPLCTCLWGDPARICRAPCLPHRPASFDFQRLPNTIRLTSILVVLSVVCSCSPMLAHFHR